MMQPIRRAIRYFWKREEKEIWVLSGIFTFFMIFGNSLQNVNSFSLVIKDWKSSMIQTLVYMILFRYLLTWVWDSLDYTNIKHCKIEEKIGNWIDSQSAWRLVLFLLILYIPYFIAFYPGIFMGDTGDIIVQGYNQVDATAEYLGLADKAVRINQHYPVLYTMFLHACIVIGRFLFHSWNAGIFICSMIQAVMLFVSFVYTLKKLKKYNVSRPIRTFVFLYFVMAPMIQNYVFLLTKDVLFGSFLLIFLMTIPDMQNNQKTGKREWIILLIATFMILFLRNDGIYIISMTFICLGIVNTRWRKRFWEIAVISIAGIYLMSNIFLPQIGIAKGSRREMLSIPFQQTARYVSTYTDEVTEEEKVSIEAILDYEHMAEDYDPNKSDAIKNSFKETATSEDMKNYFRTWWNMCLKHPVTYIEATANNVYGYFYPGAPFAARYTGDFSSKCMEVAKTIFPELNIEVSYLSGIHPLQVLLESGDFLFWIPGLSFFLMPAAYTWTLLMWAGYCISKRKQKVLVNTVPLYISMLICIAGPCNGWYFRYLFPIYLCLPAAIAVGIANLKEKRTVCEIKL